MKSDASWNKPTGRRLFQSDGHTRVDPARSGGDEPGGDRRANWPRSADRLDAVKLLLEQGLVVEAGTLIQGPGKPPMILRLEPRSRFAVGVHIDPGFITYVLLNLAVRSSRSRHTERRPHKTLGRWWPKSSIRSTRSLELRRSTRAAYSGSGWLLPGPIDIVRGVIVDPPLMMGWWNVPIRDAVAAATGMDVVFDKEVTAAAAAELWFGGPDRQNFAVMYLAAGIGTGLVLDGSVIRGATGNAGDGGRIIVNDSGVPALESIAGSSGHARIPRQAGGR